MQRIIKFLILVIFFAGVLNFALNFSKQAETPRTGEVAEEIDKEEEAGKPSAIFSDRELGLEFGYPAGPEGYVLQRAPSAGISTSPMQTLLLFQAEDYKNLNNPPEGGEGPPVISIQVFENTKKLSSEAWANANPSYSNINLKMGEVMEATIGGAKAVRYMADGLYASEVVVITHGENVYIVTGQFLDADSDLRRDLQPLLASFRFVPKPGQQ